MERQFKKRRIMVPSERECNDKALAFQEDRLDQDYAYELSVIADMEKREKEEQRKQEIEKETQQRMLYEQIEIRDFHIKQVLRKLKLGSCTSPHDILYIGLLEAWMNSSDIYLQTEHSDSFHLFLEKGFRIDPDTKEYMKCHINAKK